MSDYDRAYAQHEIRFESSNSWTLYHRDPDGTWCNHLWTQIIVGHRGAVIVTGDWPDLIVRQWCETETPAQVLAVLERFGISGSDDVAKTVVAGEGYEIDVDAAEEQIVEFVNEHNKHRHDHHVRWVELDNLPDVTDPSDVQRVRDAIFEIVGDCDVPEFGHGVSKNLLSAQAAARRLVAILRARESTTQGEAASA